MKTFRAKPEDINRKWYCIDAQGKVMGRLAVEAAKILMGKNKAQYSPDVDCGDFVIIINADKITFTGKKGEQKTYYFHSGYVGGMKEQKLKDRLIKKPESLMLEVIEGMLPNNKIGKTMLSKLKVYAGEKHPHLSQQPEVLEVL